MSTPPFNAPEVLTISAAIDSVFNGKIGKNSQTTLIPCGAANSQTC